MLNRYRNLCAAITISGLLLVGCKSTSDSDVVAAAAPPPPPTSSSGAVTLQWTPPTQNEDGSPLLDLSGYNIYYGLEQGNYGTMIPVNNPGLATYVVDNLAPNTYYFVVTAVNAADIESAYSNVATKIVN